MAVHFFPSGNCNFQYMSGLRDHESEHTTLLDILVVPTPKFGNTTTKFTQRLISGGMLLFAQGSDDRIKVRPYGPKFKALIELYGLGKVIDTGEVPNPLHGGNPGILYIWIMDKTAIAKWVKNYVDLQTGEMKKPSVDKVAVEKKVAEPKIREVPFSNYLDEPPYDDYDDPF